MEGAVETEVKEAGDAKADLGKMNDNENYNGKSEAVTVVSETAPAAPAAENEAADDVDLEDGEIEDDDEEEEQVHQMEQ